MSACGPILPLVGLGVMCVGVGVLKAKSTE